MRIVLQGALQGTIWQQLRLWSGLILFAYAATHFFNHALGLISVEAMHEFQEWRKLLTRSWLGSGVLITALLLHPSLALVKIMGRSTWRMPLWEAVQIASGIAIPLLLVPHIIYTRVAATLFGIHDSYSYELALLWPYVAWKQSILLGLVWIHGCIGLHFWLRLRGWYRRVLPVLFALVVALPVASLAGFVSGARLLAAGDVATVTSAQMTLANARLTRPQLRELRAISAISERAFWGLLAVLVGGLLARQVVTSLQSKRVTITYHDGPTIRTPIGPTLLEISRANRVPHASVCGGRGRCTTCRVIISDGTKCLPPPSPSEAAALRRIKAAPDVRIACQIRPCADITVVRLIDTNTVRNAAVAYGGISLLTQDDSKEQNLAILVLDVRGFTKLAARRMPYDVVFILNSFFAAVGVAIESETGVIDKYLGDGLMAVFGRGGNSAEGCRQALSAALKINGALRDVNAQLQSEIDMPLRIGVAIHVGRLVTGRIGHGPSAAVTVIGHAVNTTYRLEQLTKEMGCELIVSRKALYLADFDVNKLPSQTVPIRGGDDASLPVTIFKQVRHLEDAPMVGGAALTKATQS